ncbi:YciI family protein [Pseudomaricurvus sp.]|uniref:YciI family protein n=1 Tax=Pseudomaricurvus sp. TaxID=2004510 RepID=UPI003F6CAE8B
MKYLCLVYGEADHFSGNSGCPDDAAYRAYAGLLAEGGRLLAGELLTGDYSATTVQVRQGKVAVIDATKSEQAAPLAGFFLVTARDLNEAIHLASGIPLAGVGCVEIRPVRVTL